jgi:hypothetical protein
MGRFGRRACDLELRLATGAAPLVLRLTSVAAFIDAPPATAPRFVFTCPVGLGTWLDIEEAGHFAASLATTAPGQGPVTFNGASPLELELELAAGPASHGLAPRGTDPEALLDLVMAAFARLEPRLFDARSYRWLRLLQAQPSPSGQVVKAGLASIFART